MEDYDKLIQPVVLCGGNGTRLWPISSPTQPKQFVKIGNKETLLGKTLNRIISVEKECKKCGYQVYKPLLVMHKNHVLPSELLEYQNNIIYENYVNDTAVAVGRACLEIKSKHVDKNVIMLVLPADHYIENVEAFVYDIVEGIKFVDDNKIVLYGIEPTSPETKYGYILPTESKVTFKEKPDSSTALELIKKGALWNSGIFSSKCDTILNCLHNSSHNIIDWLINPREGKAASFDVAVLQEYSHIHSHYCLRWHWSDVGTWKSFTEIPHVKNEIHESFSVITRDCENVNVLNRGQGNVVIIGCSDLLVVTNGPDILIMPNTGDFNNQLKEIATAIDK